MTEGEGRSSRESAAPASAGVASACGIAAAAAAIAGIAAAIVRTGAAATSTAATGTGVAVALLGRVAGQDRFRPGRRRACGAARARRAGRGRRGGGGGRSGWGLRHRGGLATRKGEERDTGKKESRGGTNCHDGLRCVCRAACPVPDEPGRRVITQGQPSTGDPTCPTQCRLGRRCRRSRGSTRRRVAASQAQAATPVDGCIGACGW